MSAEELLVDYFNKSIPKQKQLYYFVQQDIFYATTA